MNWGAIEVGLLVFAFFLGAIPVGYLVGKRKGIDIRAVGSGNVGATNVGRALGKKAAIIVLILDALKAVIPIMMARGFVEPTDWYLILVGTIAVLGHIFTPFLRFKGGKGVATGLGMLLSATPLVGVAALVVFAIMIGLTRIVSVASVAATATVIVAAWLLGLSTPALVIYALIVTFVIFRHRSNMVRFVRGEEPKIKFGSRAKAS